MRAAPHGAAIELLALTDVGDAALTVDALGLVRLWPVLDGTREPLVVRAGPARRIALGRDGGELCAALLDPAGGIELLRFNAAGAVRARARVPGEPAYLELAFAGGVVLARGSDHAIAALDVRGGLRGRLVAGPGERITALVVRGRVAAAAIASGDIGDARALRWIDLAGLAGPGGPRWGADVALPEAVAAPLVISPGGRYLAGSDGKTRELRVLELAPKPRVVRRGPSRIDPSGEDGLGFLDEETLVLPDGRLVPPAESTAASPGTARPGGPGGAQGRLHFINGFTVADRLIASFVDSALALSGVYETWYLGYRHSALGFLGPAGTLHVLADGRQRLWIDEGLRIVREAELPELAVSPLTLDEAHSVMRMHAGPGGASREQTALVRHATGQLQPLMPDPGDVIDYEPRTRTLATLAGAEVRRWRLDLAAATVQPAGPALRVRSASAITLLDPALADGAVAVAVAVAYDAVPVVVHIETFVDPGPGARPPAKLLAPASRVTLSNEDVLDVDQRGGVWAVKRDTSRRVTVYRAGRAAAQLTAPVAVSRAAVDPAGARLAVVSERGLLGLAADGTELWRRWVPFVHQFMFSADAARLTVGTRGGILVLDAATGRELAASCGWSFGRSADVPRNTLLRAPPVCAEGAAP